MLVKVWSHRTHVDVDFPFCSVAIHPSILFYLFWEELLFCFLVTVQKRNFACFYLVLSMTILFRGFHWNYETKDQFRQCQNTQIYSTSSSYWGYLWEVWWRRSHRLKFILINVFSALMYLKLICIWGIIMAADYLLEFRFEFLWPFWLVLRSIGDSLKYQGLVCRIHFVNNSLEQSSSFSRYSLYLLHSWRIWFVISYCLFNGYSSLQVVTYGYNTFGKQVRFELNSTERC